MVEVRWFRKRRAAGPVAAGLLLERAQDAIAFQAERADRAEIELAALAGSTGTLVAAAGAAGRERAEAAEAEVARLRDLLAGQGRAAEAQEYLAPAIAARRLGVRTERLIVWEREGKLTAVRTERGHRRYRADSVEKLRRERERGAGHAS